MERELEKDLLEMAGSYLENNIMRLAGFLFRSPELLNSRKNSRYETSAAFNHNAVITGQCRAAEKMLDACQKALQRIENGTYGICLECGGEISESRLWANPETALCKQCQGKKEKKRRVGFYK
jgi:DnaK suppressor protein